MKKIFAEFVDDMGRKQFDSICELPWVESAYLMADAHGGYSAPIGSVIVADRIVPAWVGYDIGCGVTTTGITVGAEKIAEIRANSAEHYENLVRTVNGGLALTPEQERDYKQFGINLVHEYDGVAFAAAWLTNYKASVASMGSGNHFVEVGVSETNPGCLYVTVHSGSRGVGHAVARYWMEIAALLNGVESTSDPNAYEGHFALPTRRIAENYYRDTVCCRKFAEFNRELITHSAFNVLLGPGFENTKHSVTTTGTNHNHVQLIDLDLLVNTPRLDGKLLSRPHYIHRKGAISIQNGDRAVVAGNMADGVAIVRGLPGVHETMFSVCHGSGRVVSRKEAKNLSMSEFESRMSAAGVTAKVSNATLDESPAAYKNFDDVLAAHSEHVVVVDRIKPFLNVKGSK